MYLVDTNVWLERLLAQEHSDEVGEFLNRTSSNELYLTDFALHSICVVLDRLKRQEILPGFVQDLFIDGEVSQLSFSAEEMPEIFNIGRKYRLDFDDSYQYAAAEKYDLILVSFDDDFSRTSRGRKTPAEVLAALH